MKESGFENGLRELVALGCPVFAMMREQGRALVLAKGTAKQLKERFGVGVMLYFRLLVMSRRYCKAVLADGAWRHDLDGNKVEPVDDAARQRARETIKAFVARKKAKADHFPKREKVAAAAPCEAPKRPILTLRKT